MKNKSVLRASRSQRARQVAVGLLALCLLVCGVSTLAGASDSASSSESGPTSAGTAGSIKATYVGLVPQFSLAGVRASYTFTLPATPGVTWTGLSMTVNWPLPIASGTLEASDVSNNGVRLSVLRSPTDLATPQTWVIPLSSGVENPQTIMISSQLQFVDTGAQCGPAVSQVNTNVYPTTLSYVMNSRSFTVANYLTGPIDKLHIILPATEPKAAVEAGYNIEAAVVARDPNRDVGVYFSTRGGSPTSDPFARNIVFAPDAKPEISIRVHQNGSSYLYLGGTGASLRREVNLIIGSIFPLAQGQNIQAQQVPGAPHISGTTFTLSQLGITTTQTSGVGYFSLPLGFDQAAAGGEISGASVNLSGSSQIAASGTALTLTLESNGAPLLSTTPSSTGTWLLSGTLPSNIISRTVALSLVVGYFGGVGSCNSLLPVTVSVNPLSTISVTPGRSASPPGFLEVPQMLLPTTTVTIPVWRSDYINDGAQLIAGSQRLTTIPLSLTVSDADALSSGSSIVVAPSTTAVAKQLTPASVINKSATFYGSDGITQYSSIPDISLLTVAHPGTMQSILALVIPASTSGVRSAADLLGALSTQAAWQSLKGDTAVYSPGVGIVTAQVSAPTQPTLAQAASAWLSLPLTLVFLAFLFLVALLVVVSVKKRRVRKVDVNASSDKS